MIDIAKNKDRIMSQPVADAFDELVARAADNGLELGDLTGFITGVKIYRDGKYVFASQTNRHHLNFYIRRPAMTRWGPFEERARNLFPELTLNRKGEIKIHVRSKQDMTRLANWLFKLL